MGRNNVQNDKLSLKVASKSDLWLHTQKIPGSHVIIFGDGREAVNLRKQNKIKRCAEMFLLSTGIAYDYCEFHVIEITAEHLKNCF